MIQDEARTPSWKRFLDFLEGRSRPAAVLRLVFSCLTVLLAWEIVSTTLVTNRMLLVPPGEVLAALWAEAQSGAVLANAIATISAVGMAFPLAVALGVATGLALATSRLLSLTAGPMLTALYSVPIVALAPLFIAWLGLGLASKFVIVVLISVFPVIVTTEAGLRAADRALIEAARSFNATRWQIFSTVTLPYALPFIVGGVRVAWARALVGIVVAEFFGSFAGFGFAILSASQTFATATLLAYVVLLGLLGLLGSLALEALERRLAPWRQE